MDGDAIRLPDDLSHWTAGEVRDVNWQVWKRSDGATHLSHRRSDADFTAQGLRKYDKVLPMKPDPVDAPPHYTAGGIENIDFLRAKLTPEEFRGFCRGNCVKYLSRAGLKGPALEDYRKAARYLQWLIESEEGGKP